MTGMFCCARTVCHSALGDTRPCDVLCAGWPVIAPCTLAGRPPTRRGLSQSLMLRSEECTTANDGGGAGPALESPSTDFYRVGLASLEVVEGLAMLERYMTQSAMFRSPCW